LCKCNDKLNTAFKKEDVEIVLATMNRNSLDFLIQMFPFCHFSQFSILIINQTQENNLLISDFPSVRVINSLERGLSKSRNLGLQKAKGKIILLADDDEIFKKDFDSIISNSHCKYPDATVISFRIEKPDGGLFKKYPNNTLENVSQLDIFNVLSIEISINKAAFDELNIKFDENFGLGSHFLMGEEAIFLTDIKNKKQRIIIESKVIAIHPAISTDDKLNFKQRYYVQGAFLSRVLNANYFKELFLKLFFDVKQNRIKISQIPTAIRNASKGKNDFYNAY
jgi:glycosyltransferase involved in cell wall biosynthesis